MLLVDVLFEERAVGRVPVDVTLFDVDLVLLQKTSGVSTGRSRRFPVQERLRHTAILPSERCRTIVEAC
jgi:hypothetical protein